MGFLLGIAPNCERDRRGPHFPRKCCPPGQRSRGCARRPRFPARHHYRPPRSYAGCRTGKAHRSRPALRGGGPKPPEGRPTAERAGCPAWTQHAPASVSMVEASRPRREATDPTRRPDRPAYASDCTRRIDRRRFRSRTPSARPGTGSAAAKNRGSNDSLAGFFTPGKTQFKVEPPRVQASRAPSAAAP